MNNATDVLVSRKQAAMMLGISLATLDRLTNQGYIQAIRAGPRIVRYDVAALREAMQPKR